MNKNKFVTFFLMLLVCFVGCESSKQEKPKRLSQIERYQNQLIGLKSHYDQLRSRLADENFDFAYSEDTPEKRLRHEVGKAQKSELRQRSVQLLKQVERYQSRLIESTPEASEELNEVKRLIEDIEMFIKKFNSHIKLR